MIARLGAINPTARFSPREWESLRALRHQYQEDHDLFSARERARLRFIRWLRETGRI
jgi:hypothetical protein